jgi:hypothetical protein
MMVVEAGWTRWGGGLRMLGWVRGMMVMMMMRVMKGGGGGGGGRGR